jgi:cytochrome b561
MTAHLHYGAPAKLLHWLIVALLLVQYPLGWLMPDIHRGMKPGIPMDTHMSLGLIVLALIAVRLAWRLTHPIAPESSLPAWQRASSEAVHWLLYALVLATTLTGWIFASMRGWTITLFWQVPVPPLMAQGSAVGRAVGEVHQYIIWALLALALIHVAAALMHLFVYRDGVMRRMLPSI